MPALPSPLIGAYFACYDNSCQPLANTPTDPNGVNGYNTIFIFQVLPSGTSGKLSFDCSAVQSQASLKADIAAKRAAGISVILSFGGSGGYLAIKTAAIASTFVASLEAIITSIGPVDGLDWDIEGGTLYAAQMTTIGQQLKAKYGAGVRDHDGTGSVGHRRRGRGEDDVRGGGARCLLSRSSTSRAPSPPRR